MTTDRRLGWVGGPLALAMVVAGYITTVEQGRRGFALWWDPDQKADVLAEIVHPFGDLLSFTVLVTAGFLWRRRPDVHKRLMLLATVGSMMAAPVTHFLGYFPGLREGPPVILLPLAALYFSSALYDRVTHRRIHPVSLWGGIPSLLFGAHVEEAMPSWGKGTESRVCCSTGRSGPGLPRGTRRRSRQPT